MEKDADVIVIGAGASGLAAAKRLCDAGRTVLVVDARDRIGGRIHTVHDPAFPIPVEHGAEFIHGRPEETWEIVRDAPLLAVDMADEHWHFRDGRLQPAGDFWEKMQIVMDRLSLIGDRDISFRQFIQEYCQAPEFREGAALAISFVEGFDASDANRISAQSVKKENEDSSGEDDHRQFKILSGYDGLLKGFAAAIRGKSRLLLSAPVTTIQWSARSVRIITSKGTFSADKAIITLPLGVWQVAPPEAGAVAFQPELPVKRDAARRLAMGGVVKILLRFESAFWEEDERLKDVSFFHSQEAWFPTWWNFLPARTTCLTGWAGGPAADRLSGKGDQFALARALETLARIFNRPMDKLRELLLAHVVSDWEIDPFARGAYSYTPVGGADAMKILAEPVEGILFFAGEATHYEDQAGTVAGAIASGYRAAGEVARS